MNKLTRTLQELLVRLLTSISFCLLPYYVGYIIYFSIFNVDFVKVLIGCVSLYIMIHLNKSL